MILVIENENERKEIKVQQATTVWMLSCIYSFLKIKQPTDSHEFRKGEQILELLKLGKVKISFQETDGQKEYVTYARNLLTNILEDAKLQFELDRRKVYETLLKINDLSFEQKKYIANMIDPS